MEYSTESPYKTSYGGISLSLKKRWYKISEKWRGCLCGGVQSPMFQT